MADSRRRLVWWNVHSNPELSLVSWEQARDLRNGGLIALLNGCSVGGFAQPGSNAAVDTKVTPERNVLVNLVYGQSAFVAAMGSVHDRVTDERATPLLRHLYSGGYLGRAHLLRLQQQDRDVQGNPTLVRGFQEILIGDAFADALQSQGLPERCNAGRVGRGGRTSYGRACAMMPVQDSPGGITTGSTETPFPFSGSKSG